MKAGRRAGWVVAALVASATIAATAIAGEFGGPRLFCDSTEPNSLYWRAQELPGDKNVVVAGFRESSNRILVADDGTDAAGDPIGSIVTCSRSVDAWERFSAVEGSENDVVRLDGVTPEATDYGSVPERIFAEIDLGSGNDEAEGHAGVDKIKGGPGKDLLVSLDGNDRIKGNGGKDKVRSGPGRDKVNVAGGGKDKVNCGPDKDKAVIDDKDKTVACEQVKVR